MKCNRLKLIFGSFLVVFLTLLIFITVLESYYFLILLAFWLIMVYLKTAFVYKVEKENITLVWRFKVYKIKPEEVLKVYARRGVEGYRGFLFECLVSEKTLHIHFPFGFEYYVVDVLNYMNGYYNIDVKSFEKIGILYDQKIFKYLPDHFLKKNKSTR